MNWIKSSEKLPEKGGYVVVMHEGFVREFYLAHYNPFKNIFMHCGRLLHGDPPIKADYWIAVDVDNDPEVYISIDKAKPFKNSKCIVYHHKYRRPYMSYWQEDLQLFLKHSYGAIIETPPPLAVTHWFCPPQLLVDNK